MFVQELASKFDELNLYMFLQHVSGILLMINS